MDLRPCPRIKIELNSWMQPDYFPVLKYLYLSSTGIVTILESISRFTRLIYLEIKNCKKLQEIPRLPQSIRTVDADNCYRLDPQSSSRLWNQVSLFLFLSEFKGIKKQFMLNFDFLQFGEILGSLPNVVAEATRNSKSKIYWNYLILPATEIPKWFKFNHH